MEFRGNPSVDLGLDYHTFSESEKNGKIVTRYTLSGPVDSEVEKELAKYENVKLVKNGASHRHAPEIKYDVLYVSVDPDISLEEEVPAVAEEDLSEDEILGKLDIEIMGPEEDSFSSLSKYASVTSAMAEVNSQILMYRSLGNQFPEDKALFDSLVSECEVQLGKLSSIISTPETESNMSKGLAEGEALAGESPATESFEDEHLGK